MVYACVACLEKYAPEKKISFHLFPKDQNLRSLWIKSMNKEDFIYFENSKLCGQHFTPDCMLFDPITGRTRLRPNAVPSIFNYSKGEISSPPFLEPQIKLEFPELYNVNKTRNIQTRPPILEQQPYQISGARINNQSTTSNGVYHFMDPQSRSSNINQIEKYKNQQMFLNKNRNMKSPSSKIYETQLLAKRKLRQKNQQIRLLQERNDRLTDRINHLEHVLCHLKENNLINKEAEHIIEIVWVNSDFLKSSMCDQVLEDGDNEIDLENEETDKIL